MNLCQILVICAACALAQDKAPKVHFVHGTVYFSGTVARSAAGKNVFDLAFQTFVAHAAGHVCGSNEACSPNDVMLTETQSLSIGFRLRVANGQIAAQAMTNIRSQLKDGSAFAASLRAAGVTSVANVKEIVFGEQEAPQSKTAKNAPAEANKEDATTGRFKRLFRIFRCGKVIGIISGILVVLLLALVFKRLFRAAPTLEAAGVQPVTVVVSVAPDVAKDAAYAPVSKDQV